MPNKPTAIVIIIAAILLILSLVDITIYFQPSAFEIEFFDVVRLPLSADTVSVVVMISNSVYALGAVVGLTALELAIKRRYCSALVLVIALVSLLSIDLLKTIFHRSRPLLNLAWEQAQGFGFPSGHSLAVTVMVGSIWLVVPTSYRKPTLIAGVIYALLIGYSRLWLGVHYPSDVLAGYAFGLLIVSLLMVGQRFLTKTALTDCP